MKQWIKSTAVKMVKTMAETALSLIGTNTTGITDIDWVGLASAVALAGLITILFNIKNAGENLK